MLEDLPNIKQEFTVNYSYQLYFTKGLFEVQNELLTAIITAYTKHSKKVLFVVDKGVVDAHPNLLESITRYANAHKAIMELKAVVVVPGGEAAKVQEQALQAVLRAIEEHGICRHSFVVSVGGGAVIDMVGYAAATAHRGIALLRVPTTVLAQNDAAVGVKNAINTFGKKNFLGTFAVPRAIINDLNFLETLSQKDWIAGVAEAVKVALIKDAPFFEFIAQHAQALVDRDLEVMGKVIHRCAALHMDHIASGGDPFESGSSRPLDFGHWAAHKLEQMTHFALRHGEAVAKGMALDLTYANLVGLLPGDVVDRVLAVLTALGFDYSLPISDKEAVITLLEGLEEFREHLGGQLTITLITAIGHQHEVHQIDMEMMTKAIQTLNTNTLAHS
ncbi:MAG: 3-dehydroquinate synthase [Bacteroidota bacterium]